MASPSPLSVFEYQETRMPRAIGPHSQSCIDTSSYVRTLPPIGTMFEKEQELMQYRRLPPDLKITDDTWPSSS